VASIGFHKETLERPGFADDLTRIDNHRRRIPVPRRTLRWLTRATRPVLVATVLGHLFRCVYSKGGSVAFDGSISATWIAGTFKVDHRNVKRAKAELRAVDWLADLPSQHWHRQRYGGTVRVNLAWRDENRPRRGQCSGAELPPRLSCSRTGLPPPDSHKELPKEARNQKRDGGTGVEEQAGTLRKPRLAHVVPEDLREPARTAELFHQAARHGLVKDCPMDRLQFFAAAERAKRLAHNPGGCFAAILQRRLWRNIATCDEESARRELAKIPDFFHGSTPCLDTRPWTSAASKRASAKDKMEDPATIRELVRRSLAGAALADRAGSPHADSPLPPRVGGISPAEQNGVKEGTRVLAGRRPLRRFVEPSVAAQVGGAPSSEIIEERRPGEHEDGQLRGDRGHLVGVLAGAVEGASMMTQFMDE
jgi:hypothetical protein